MLVTRTVEASTQYNMVITYSLEIPPPSPLFSPFIPLSQWREREREADDGKEEWRFGVGVHCWCDNSSRADVPVEIPHGWCPHGTRIGGGGITLWSMGPNPCREPMTHKPSGHRMVALAFGGGGGSSSASPLVPQRCFLYMLASRQCRPSSLPTPACLAHRGGCHHQAPPSRPTSCLPPAVARLGVLGQWSPVARPI